MGNDQEYIYGENAMLKLIRDPGSVRLKLCPGIAGPMRFDETVKAVSIDLDRKSINMLIRHLRKQRDRTFGRDE